jgi:hypothetical protein
MPEDQAVAVFAEAGLRPLEKYPGSARPWRARHACGGIVSPTPTNVRVGKGICRYCNSTFPFASEADLYLVTDGTALKIGIAAPGSGRIATHRRYGWLHLWSIRFVTGDAAYNMEQAVLRWWRDALALPPAYATSEMPQEGATETVKADQISHPKVLEFVLRTLEEQGVLNPDIQFPPEMTLR